MSLKRLLQLATSLILLLVSIFLYQKPNYNWDLFPYMALAAKSSIPFDSTHAYIYKEASLHMPAKDFNAISQRQPTLMQSPSAFMDILKYYKIKPGFILAIKFFHFLGFNLLASTYLPSIVSYFFIGCLLFAWMQKLLPLTVAAVLMLVISASSFLIIPARYSSPDMLSAAVMLGGLFLISETSVIGGLIVCALAIPIRPDSVILFLFLNMALYKTKKINLLAASAIGILGATITLMILGGTGLLKEFLFTASDFSTSWTVADMMQNYFHGLWAGLNSFISSQTVTFLFLAFVTLFLRKKAYGKISNDFLSQLTFAALATFVTRYLLHPVVEDRFQIACYLIIILGFCATISNQRKHVNT